MNVNVLILKIALDVFSISWNAFHFNNVLILSQESSSSGRTLLDASRGSFCRPHSIGVPLETTVHLGSMSYSLTSEGIFIRINILIVENDLAFIY